MSIAFKEGILFTIICEAFLQDRLIHLLQTVGVSGYTIIPAQGAGSHGRRMGDIAGYNTNIEVKTIVTPEKSDKLLDELDLFETSHALIAFRHKVDGLFDEICSLTNIRRIIMSKERKGNRETKKPKQKTEGTHKPKKDPKRHDALG